MRCSNRMSGGGGTKKSPNNRSAPSPAPVRQHSKPDTRPPTASAGSCCCLPTLSLVLSVFRTWSLPQHRSSFLPAASHQSTSQCPVRTTLTTVSLPLTESPSDSGCHPHAHSPLTHTRGIFLTLSLTLRVSYTPESTPAGGPSYTQCHALTRSVSRGPAHPPHALSQAGVQHEAAAAWRVWPQGTQPCPAAHGRLPEARYLAGGRAPPGCSVARPPQHPPPDSGPAPAT